MALSRERPGEETRCRLRGTVKGTQPLGDERRGAGRTGSPRRRAAMKMLGAEASGRSQHEP